MVNKTIVVFANSIKHKQHCVAGKCIETKEWIRPVGDPTGYELTHEQAKSENPYGIFLVKPLQKIVVDLVKHTPLINQPENWLIGDERWKQEYKITANELVNYLDKPSNLWGEFDSVEFSDIKSSRIVIEQSLYLVFVENLSLYKNEYKKRRASFAYEGLDYDLAVTDPNFDTILEENRITKSILCISLGEEYQGKCYKLIATIF